MNTKVLIVILVVIVVLFIVGMVLGGSKGNSLPKFDDLKASLKNLTSGFSLDQPLKPADVAFTPSSNCQVITTPDNTRFTQFNIAPGSCAFTLTRNDKKVRALPLQLAPGQIALIKVIPADPNDKQNPSQDITLPTSDGSYCQKVVMRGGGNLTLTCAVIGGCQFSVVTSCE